MSVFNDVSKDKFQSSVSKIDSLSGSRRGRNMSLACKRVVQHTLQVEINNKEGTQVCGQESSSDNIIYVHMV